MKQKILQLKREIIEKIYDLLAHYDLQKLYISNIEEGYSPVLQYDTLCEHTFTLDKIDIHTIDGQKHISLDGSSSYQNLTWDGEDLSVEILEDILEFLLDHEDEIDEYAYVDMSDMPDPEDAWLEAESNRCEQEYFNR